MILNIKKGDLALTPAQLERRMQKCIRRVWPDWKRERSIRKDDGEFGAFIATSVSPCMSMCEANNLFNNQVASRNEAQARLARYVLSEGRPEIWEEQETGEYIEDEPIYQSVLVQTAIEPLPAEVEQYDDEGEVIMVPNPAIIQDNEERAAAQSVIDGLPDEVMQWVS